jgi:hypothetical protein
MRQRLIELYTIHKIKTQKAIDTWRRDNRYPKVDFRPDEWKIDRGNLEDLRKAMIQHENQVNLIYIKQTMTERDVEWVIKDIIDSLIGIEKRELWDYFCSDAKVIKASTPSELDDFFAEYDYSLSNEQNLKVFKKWKKAIAKELAKASV